MLDSAPRTARARRNLRLLQIAALFVACHGSSGSDDSPGNSAKGGASVSGAGQAGAESEPASGGAQPTSGGSSGAQSGGATSVAGSAAESGASSGGATISSGGSTASGGDEAAQSGGSAGRAAGEAGATIGGAAPGCDAPVIQQIQVDDWTHVSLCDPVEYNSNPPAGGRHYPVWAAFQSYDFPLPKGVAVHDLEHGGVVFWYNCPEGCADEVAEVEALIANLPEDLLCVGQSAQRRVVLTPAPDLPVRWAMSAAGYTLSSNCVNRAAFEDFYLSHVGQGPEMLCADGVAFDASPCP